MWRSWPSGCQCERFRSWLYDPAIADNAVASDLNGDRGERGSLQAARGNLEEHDPLTVPAFAAVINADLHRPSS
jgi:hypothetical protein